MNRKIKNILIILVIFIIVGLSYVTMKSASNNTNNSSSSGGPNSMGIPPDMTQGSDGNTTSSENGQTPPSKPDDNNNQTESNGQGQTPPAKPDEESALIIYLIMSNFNLKTLNETLGSGIKALSFTIIIVVLGGALTFLQIYITNNYLTTENSQSQEMPQGGGMMNGGTNSNVTYTATKTVTENTSIDGETYTSTTSDEDGLLADGDIDVTASNITVTKSGNSDSGDTSNFYGNNSAILAKESMSGDAKDGTAVFTANNCNITTNNGDTFYITNTTAEIDLRNNIIINNDSDGNFLRAQKDSWGNSGSNGGNVTLKMSNQKATGRTI